ncbi:MAG: Na(+)-translocating NADH-quinone reductase subunit A [Pseudomonadales bacterium]|nr:Na(+)-translocating NADH-quinone reductase subunit A [Pseudomonadales bacterium]MBO6565253.1 Na(+)-translocating NADH-quinone reductase subunit A [Pseudomonadales bacterium]MBO6595925.1 Na(+)-translocating NADH-quinone reductase subunit A [Pseudomonadales bacterium]MBO6822408.1 Na(+)-translocating NADH-quinone reductase subunit A [Pseudomonadales bacterium]
MIKTKRGLDLPIIGSPKQSIEDSPEVRQVALVGYDYPGLKPTMEVREGDKVKAGQLVFTDKKTDGVRYTAPASGTVKAINRGEKRVFESLVIELDGDEQETFTSYRASDLRGLDRDKVVENLVTSGQWTAIRTRPYSKVPAPSADAPSAFFITAADTRPHCPDPALFINEQAEAYLAGIDVLSRLTEGQVFVCANAGSELPQSDNPQVVNESFSGPHPAGNVGTHIHFLHPVHTNRNVWYAGYQDVIAIGQLFLTGNLFFDRVVALSGPEVKEPRVIRTRLGASTDELTKGQLNDGNNRIISGSIVDGRRASDGTGYLGRFHNQVSALHEGTERELLEFVSPGMNKFSLTRLYLGVWKGGLFRLSTSTEGSERSIIPIGTYERVMPLDILPVPLLKALVVSDFDASIELGALELDEEDVALCTFACPGKYEYGPYLREMLTRIEVES